LLFGCGEERSIPKPPTYLRTEFPAHEYSTYTNQNCSYRFSLPKTFHVKDVVDSAGTLLCHKNIELGPLNGIIHFSYINMTEPLSNYVNYANNKVDDHKVMASAIEDQKIIHPEKRVFGTFFELQGNVATPFQFYLTDSTSRFVSGVLYFNCRPNYDSLKPSIDYVKLDLLKLVHSFEWK
jgi:gliding motility-associated lipoprotein GldD